jgi:hypothetical protein
MAGFFPKIPALSLADSRRRFLGAGCRQNNDIGEEQKFRFPVCQFVVLVFASL